MKYRQSYPNDELCANNKGAFERFIAGNNQIFWKVEQRE